VRRSSAVVTSLCVGCEPSRPVVVGDEFRTKGAYEIYQVELRKQEVSDSCPLSHTIDSGVRGTAMTGHATP
jgi:hypothetical protein